MSPEIQKLASFYLLGSDNSSIDDLHPGYVRADLLTSWRTFAAQDKTSRYNGLVVALLARIGENNRPLTESDMPLFEQYGLQKDFHFWLRRFSAQ